MAQPLEISSATVLSLLATETLRFAPGITRPSTFTTLRGPNVDNSPVRQANYPIRREALLARS